MGCRVQGLALSAQEFLELAAKHGMDKMEVVALISEFPSCIDPTPASA